MRILPFVSCGLIVCGLAVAGCSRSTAFPTVLSNGASVSERSDNNFKVLYSFEGGADGETPAAGLTALNDKLYGTTTRGGTPRRDRIGGTVFEVDVTGRERVIHRFDRGSLRNGANPETALMALKDTLYGTTSSGGAYGLGTVFEMTTAGRELVLHSFGSIDKDGANPVAGLLRLNGEFYGVTTFGGTANEGTVFKITTSGIERVVYSFQGGNDGARPSGLIAANGKLYGTTLQGGDVTCECGTVFELSTLGVERVIHRFVGGKDGSSPYAGLVELNGTFYGTTDTGGNPNCNFGAGCGTVFAVRASGSERVLYAFAKNARADGVFPQTGLTAINGTLYGTTQSCDEWGYGTVFEVSTSGKERVLYTFTGGSDGAHPSDLIDLGGVLYGTTPIGGANDYGIVFALSL